MGFDVRGWRWIPLVFWVCASIAIVVWAFQPGYVVGWDLNVYKLAIVSLRHGHDPYLDCVAARKLFFDHLALHPDLAPPYGYVYPPVTLPLLRWIGAGSLTVAAVLYWMLYVACAIAALWAGTVAIEPQERRTFAYLLPAVIFFPGLLQYDCLFSGNVAYIVFGCVLGAAAWGWRTGRWMWIYPAILLASLTKPTFLTLLAIPVLSARRQWAPAAATGAAGLGLVLWQAHHWPVETAHYRLALLSQVVEYTHDFGMHPAGLLADALFNVLPYPLVIVGFYGLCAVLFGGVLLVLRQRFLKGEVRLRQWIPVMLLGVTLLNPRIMEYDTAPMAIPMLLVAWRFFGRCFGSRRATIIAMSVLFVVVNVTAKFAWKQTECLLLVGLFAAGAWTLWREAAQAPAARAMEAEPYCLGA